MIQHGKSYYKCKQRVFRYGIVEPATGRRHIYVIDEQNAPGKKNGNLIINLLLQYVKREYCFC